MVDLHTHILPNIDDGPETIEESLRLLQMELVDGILTVAFTPHFSVDNDNLGEFIHKRDLAAETLFEEADKKGIRIRSLCAAEVALSPEILALSSVESLCYENSAIMLVELPLDFFWKWIPQTLYELKLRGITAVIAHAERYHYFRKDIKILQELVNAGFLVQINAESILCKNIKTKRFIKDLFQKNLIHVIASDTHSVSYRPPNLAAAIKEVEKNFGNECAKYIVTNGESVIGNQVSLII